MACSNPFKLRKEDIKQSIRPNHSDFELNALRRSFNEQSYYNIPCGRCLNCRVDRQNELVDRAEYEYIKYGCGAFVTFTYDDFHNFQNAFINSKTGELQYTINKKDGKDFLNRLNKLVHQDNKKTGYNPLCRKDYKYIITHEYGDKFNRNHIHCLFFGLDFAYCERLFWRAWNFQGSIEVGPIKNGGIPYCVKYISDMQFGKEKFYKYIYNGLTAPCSSHSLGLGEDLYKGQLKYINSHNGCYRWHGVDRPVPSYYKNKFRIISDLQQDKYEKRYKSQCDRIYNLYEHKITSYKDFQDFNVDLAIRRQNNLAIKLRQSGKEVLDLALITKQQHDLVYSDNHRLNPKFDNYFVRVVDINGNAEIKLNDKNKKFLTTRDLMKMHLGFNNLVKMYGIDSAYKMIGNPIPF